MTGDPSTSSSSSGGPTWRSRRTPGPGAFLVMDQAKQAARAAGKQVLDLSIGTSDLPPPPEALTTLQEAIADPSTYQYCLKSHTRPLRQAAVDWYARLYGVDLDPDKQALSLMGTQEGLAHLLLAVADPGDALLLPDVAYPSYFGAARVAGLDMVHLPLAPPSFLPDFNALPPEVTAALPRCRALLLNYPNNPTAATADEGFWAAALAFARKHDLLLIHDNPYALQVFDGAPATSPLSLPGAASHVVELFSCSKAFQLGGFRLGVALGNADALAALEAVKAPIDFNQYIGIQRMAVTCLGLGQGVQDVYNAQWAERGAALAAALRRHCGWEVEAPAACMYLWIKLPEEVGADDLSFCRSLLAATGLAISPGSGFGPGGCGFIRFALVAPPVKLEAAAQLLGAHLQALRAARAGSNSNLNLNSNEVLDSCKGRREGPQVATGDATKGLTAALAKGLALGGGNTSSSKGSPRQQLLSPKQYQQTSVGTSSSKGSPLLSPKHSYQQVIQVSALEEGSEDEGGLQDQV